MLTLNTLPDQRFFQREPLQRFFPTDKTQAAAAVLKATHMTRPQENKLLMMMEVEKELKAHEMTWKDHPAFSQAVTIFRSEYAMLAPEMQNQKAINAAKAVRKAARTQLELLGAKIAAALHAHALHTGDSALAVDTNISKTALIRLRDELLPAAIQKIADAAALGGGTLVDERPVPEVVIALNAALSLFKKQDTLLRNAAQQSTDGTINIGAHIARAVHRLDIMDGLAGGFHTTGKDFVKAYRCARASIFLGKNSSNTTDS